MNKYIVVGQTAYGHFKCALKSLRSPFLLFVRAYWGWMFLQTGYGKLTHIDKIAGFFESLHIPMPLLNAYMAGLTECVGGGLLLIGLASRLISIPLVVTMIVAYSTAHVEEFGKIFSDPEKFYGAAPFTFLMASLIVLFFGPGKLSVDYLISRCFGKSSACCSTEKKSEHQGCCGS